MTKRKKSEEQLLAEMRVRLVDAAGPAVAKWALTEYRAAIRRSEAAARERVSLNYVPVAYGYACASTYGLFPTVSDVKVRPPLDHEVRM